MQLETLDWEKLIFRMLQTILNKKQLHMDTNKKTSKLEHNKIEITNKNTNNFQQTIQQLGPLQTV